MTYRIQGLHPKLLDGLRGRSDEILIAHGARRVTADAKPGFPCRVTLEDADPGDSLILFNHVSHDVGTPYRSAFAIYVREDAQAPACYRDEVPPIFHHRTLGLRGFDAQGMLKAALLTDGGEADAGIRALFERPEIATIHAHNAAHGCFAAQIVRD